MSLKGELEWSRLLLIVVFVFIIFIVILILFSKTYTEGISYTEAINDMIGGALGG